MAAAIKYVPPVETAAPAIILFIFSVDVAETLTSLADKISVRRSVTGTRSAPNLYESPISAVTSFLNTLTTISPLTPAPPSSLIRIFSVPATSRVSLFVFALTSISPSAVMVEPIILDFTVS